jgi:hypothetical protein
VPKELVGKQVTINLAFDLAPVQTVCKPIQVTLKP